MARPMLLMEKTLLNTLYLKYEQGVPVLKLIRQYDIAHAITAPTLTKLLSYMDAMAKSELSVKQVIYNSLFPTWFIKNKKLTQTNPPEWYYVGRMPLGEWKERD